MELFPKTRWLLRQRGIRDAVEDHVDGGDIFGTYFNYAQQQGARTAASTRNVLKSASRPALRQALVIYLHEPMILHVARLAEITLV